MALEDALPYDEPWGWMQPTLHALGALLLEQVAEAEAAYRADLGLNPRLPRGRWHPDNLWSLHGLHERLAARGDPAAGIVEQRLRLALARADVPVGATAAEFRSASVPSLKEKQRRGAAEGRWLVSLAPC